MYDLEVSISCFSYGCWIYQYHLLKGHLSPLFYSVVVLNLVTVYIWVCFYNIFCSVGLFYIYTHTYICILEKAMALHSSPLAWKIPWTEEPGRLQSMGSLGVRHDWATSLSLSCIGEGNGNPLQCPCLENPRDGGAWWAAISGVAQSGTRLKQLSSSSSSKKRILR